jgi:hypothetical protein
MQPNHELLDTRERMRIWMKRAGIAGFSFFLAKGLLWLIVPFALFRMGAGS